MGNQDHITKFNILSHVFLIHGFFPGYANSILGVEWYLGVLAVFIVCIPFIWKRNATLQSSVIWMIAGSFLCSCICSLLNYSIPDMPENYIYREYLGICFFVTHFPVLLLSRVFYFAVKEIQKNRVVGDRILSDSLLFFCIWMIGGEILQKNQLFGIGSYTMFGFWFFILAMSQAIKPSSLITNAGFSFIGKHSYPIYLFHYIFIIFENKLFMGETAGSIIVKYIITLSISCIIAVLLDKFVQRPLEGILLKMLKRICKLQCE